MGVVRNYSGILRRFANFARRTCPAGIVVRGAGESRRGGVNCFDRCADSKSARSIVNAPGNLEAQNRHGCLLDLLVQVIVVSSPLICQAPPHPPCGLRSGAGDLAPLGSVPICASLTPRPAQESTAQSSRVVLNRDDSGIVSPSSALIRLRLSTDR